MVHLRHERGNHALDRRRHVCDDAGVVVVPERRAVIVVEHGVDDTIRRGRARNRRPSHRRRCRRHERAVRHPRVHARRRQRALHHPVHQRHVERAIRFAFGIRIVREDARGRRRGAECEAARTAAVRRARMVVAPHVVRQREILRAGRPRNADAAAAVPELRPAVRLRNLRTRLRRRRIDAAVPTPAGRARDRRSRPTTAALPRRDRTAPRCRLAARTAC